MQLETLACAKTGLRLVFGERKMEENILSLEKMIQNVVGDVLLSASFISYAGPFSKHYREILVKNELMNFIMKRSIPKTADIGPIEFLVDEAVKA